MQSMTPLFSDAGQACLQEFMQPGVLCVFDFDGTLAPIVAQPDQAALPAAVRQRLLRLQALTPVAILTGRAIDDIRSRLGFEPNYLVGNHGLEGLPDSGSRRAGMLGLCADWRHAIDAALADQVQFDPAIVIEDKAISLSLHFRHAQDAAAAEAALLTLFATLMPAPRIIAGKYVFNLLPQGAGDKGTAFEELMRLSGAARAVYIGDDVTDEDVFQLARGDLLSIRVGQAAGSAAPYFLQRYDDIPMLLDDMLGRLHLAPLAVASQTSSKRAVVPVSADDAAASPPPPPSALPD